MTFLSITFTEVFRAYTVRSFVAPVFVGMFQNWYMQFAAIAVIILSMLVTHIPIIMDDVFGFRYLKWFHWLIVITGALLSVICGELLKCFIRTRDRSNARWDEMHDGFNTILLEIRNLRHHVENLEDKLEIKTRKPTRRLPNDVRCNNYEYTKVNTADGRSI